ncbi:hypothetical protein GCM10010441_75440 [Kitasatospora paracochleata]|uniref:Uncharacterized protein n=1 Tax=Kitasatospora paracochleata TaxID=58354 RepID=A0ABT1J9X8_9ACTN|nr:hypothetical protein [Kitasatospora paracochleata]MCP2314257.1 hypothetical protein [Kitasatospora paracochleata]
MPFWKRRGELTLVPAVYNPQEVLWAMDGSVIVGAVITSDVYPGQFRASVYGRDTRWMNSFPVSGVRWICARGGAEVLVAKPQAGTEDFLTPRDALAAIARNRLL